MFQPLLDAYIESAPIKKKLHISSPPPPKNRCGELVGR
ncbi:Alpha1,3-fucosyltransferase [Helicobacter pylori ELS37]|uniref:Alpha1,3-fucosyltransferase n=1 Tax=Helicobacter pylori ELS37 TaxID=1055527 RepID=A0ABC7ZEB2_HELPX|nr:Alpha1,3-fucosyltransferase [Helicobacter pylori ELS37]